MHFLENLYFCIDDILQRLADAAVLRISVLTSVQKHSRMHILMGPYVCDNAESEDPLELKRGNRTNSPCYHCLLPKSDMSRCKLGDVRTLGETLTILDMHNRSECEEKYIMETYSMLSIKPIWFKFPMAKIHPTLGMY